MRRTVLIGSAPARYTTGINAARARLKLLLAACRVEAGGARVKTTEAENYPGSQAESLAATSWSRRRRNDGL